MAAILVPVDFVPEPLELVILTGVGLGLCQDLSLSLNLWAKCHEGTEALSVAIESVIFTAIIVFAIFRRRSWLLDVVTGLWAFLILVNILHTVAFVGFRSDREADQDCGCIADNMDDLGIAIFDIIMQVIILICVAFQSRLYRKQIRMILLNSDEERL
ncbi:hypothetical protein HDE_08663 [Halotydeus destructor]|nr:hypothetical protein HDE_08663 [Halotydeus destructor]